MPLEALVEALETTISEFRGEPRDDLRALPTRRLIELSMAKHRSFLTEMMPTVRSLSSRVSQVHGGKNPKLRDLDMFLDELAERLQRRVHEEEAKLFPAMMDAAQTPWMPEALDSMVEDHHDIVRLLELSRDATEDFHVPDWACNSYRSLVTQLEQLETELLAHLHLEQHALAPRFAPGDAAAGPTG